MHDEVVDEQGERQMKTNRNTITTIRTMLLAGAVMAAPGLVRSQTITYNGNVPETYSILDTSNSAVGYTDSVVFQNAIGSGSLKELTESVRLRSNAAYKLSAQVTTNTGIATGTASAASNTAQAIKLGDIGFGISNIDKSGASVVGGGATPTRADTIATNFSYSAPSVVDGRLTWSPGMTLNDVQSAATQILNGDRISASGDNGSDDNFLVVSLKAGYVPEYFTPGNFTVVVTLTIAASGA